MLSLTGINAFLKDIIIILSLALLKAAFWVKIMHVFQAEWKHSVTFRVFSKRNANFVCDSLLGLKLASCFAGFVVFTGLNRASVKSEDPNMQMELQHGFK